MKEQLYKLLKLFKELGGPGAEKIEQIGFLGFLILVGISFLAALFISFLYSKFYRSRATGSMVHRVFPLLGISITSVFLCIQFSLPLSLGLLGALSIVRFRTPIKEPEEIGFIMLVVASSLCCATFNFRFLGVLLLITVVALFTQQLFGSSRGLFRGRFNDGMLIFTLTTPEYQTHNKKILALLEKSVHRGRIDSIAADQEKTVLTYSFIQLDKDKLLQLQDEMRNIVNFEKFNVFFNRSGEL